MRPGLPPFLRHRGTRNGTLPCLQPVRFAEKPVPVLEPERATLDLLEGAGYGDARFNQMEKLERFFTFLDRRLLRA